LNLYASFSSVISLVRELYYSKESLKKIKIKIKKSDVPCVPQPFNDTLDGLGTHNNLLALGKITMTFSSSYCRMLDGCRSEGGMVGWWDGTK
jgi:hypothetical protein